MSFQIVGFTNTGLTTLQRVASSKSLVIDEVIPCSTAVSENDAFTQPASFFEAYRNRSVTAKVISAGSDPESDTNARIVVSLQSTSTQSEVIKMLIIVAHSTEGGVPTSAATFLACLDETGLTVTYNPNIPVKINVAVSFAFNRTANITLSSSEPNYLLQDEAARFVSTHSPSGPLVGENQTIYGIKTFNSKVILDGTLGGELDFYYYDDPLIRVYQGNDFGLIFDTMPDAEVFDTDRIYEFKVENQDLMLVGKNENGGVVITDQVTATTGQFDVLKGRSQEEEIQVTAHIKPISGASCGDTDSKWERVGTDKLFANSIQSTDSADGTIACLSTIKPNVSEAYNLGAATSRWANVYAQTINCDDIIDATGAGSLLRAPGANGDLKIGSITCVYDKLITLGLNLSGTCGKEITVAANTVHYAVSQVVTLHTLKSPYNAIPVTDNTVNLTNFVSDTEVVKWSKSQYTIPAGRYVILNAWTETSLNNNNLFIIQRVG